MRGKFLAALMISGIVALVRLAGCKQKAGENANLGADSTASGAAPEASLAIPMLEGSTASLDQYKGKVVLVNFWASWCDPCKTEIHWLIEFTHQYAPTGLVILGIPMDDEGKKAGEPWVKT